MSAIDMGRIWERCMRRADLPIAYSEGFSPHPKISFPDALSLGYASTGEYAELTFATPVTVGPAMLALNEAFPDGLEVFDAVAVADGDPKLAKLLQASLWEMAYPAETDLAGTMASSGGLPGMASSGGLPGAVAQAAAADELVVARQRKGEPVDVDLRPAVHQICVGAAGVRVVLHHVEPAVRPSEVDLALRTFLPDLPPPALITRLAQGRPVPEGLVEALSGVTHTSAGDPSLQRHAS